MKKKLECLIRFCYKGFEVDVYYQNWFYREEGAVCVCLEEESQLWHMWDECEYLYCCVRGMRYLYRGYEQLDNGDYRLVFRL